MKTISVRLSKTLYLAGCGGMLILFGTGATPSPGTSTPGGNAFPGLWLWNCFLFGLLGVAMVVIGFKVFDWLLRRVDIEGEVAKGNVAAAILGASVVIGISIIIGFAIN